MTGFEIVRKEQKSECSILQPVVVYIMLLAIFVAYTSVFAIDVSLIRFCISLLFAVGINYGIKNIKWNGKNIGRLIIGIAIFFIFIYVFLDWFNIVTVKNAAGVLTQSFFEAYNKYYGTEIVLDTEYTNYNAVLLVLFLVQLCLGFVLLFIARKKKGLIVFIVIALLPIILAALVGYMPSVGSTLMLIAATLFYVICYKKQESISKKELVISAIVLLVLFSASIFSSQKLYDYVDKNIDAYLDIRYKIQMISNSDIQKIINTTGNDLSNYANGGIGEGDFRNLTQFVPSGEGHLEVVVDELPEEDLYLRAYVGTEYTNDGWKIMKGSTFSRLISMWSDSDVRNVLLSEPFNRVSEGNTDLETSHIYVTITGGSMEYAYAPYYAYIPNSENVVMDSYVSGSRQDEHEFEYYPRYQADNLNDSQLAESSEIWKSYQEFVWEEYLDYPDDMSQLQTFCENINSSSILGIETSLNNYFQNGFIYSYVPGKYPKDEDFVEYFMFTKQRGFCIHYATAATMVYRVCGYPARYVEGYKVNVEDFKLQEDGTYKAYVTDKKAHAWCETFDDEKGWQVREHTLGYVEGQNIENYIGTDQQQERETTTHNGETTENETTSSVERQNNTKINPNKVTKTATVVSFSKIVKIILGIIVAILFVLILFAIQRVIRRNNKIRKYKYTKGNSGIISIYNAIYEICIFKGMKRDNKSDKEVFESIKKMFVQLDAKDWDWIFDCVSRASFSNQKISREEQRRMYILYKKFRRSIYKELNSINKIIFLYIRAM